MDPNLLQSMIGNLSFGFPNVAYIREFEKTLKLPDDGILTITAEDASGAEHVVAMTGKETLPAEPVCQLGYHAVFLLGQQVYFGKIQITHDQKCMQISDAHYMMPGNNGRRDMRLIKVNSELHAPIDGMTVNMAYVIMWQPLRDDGPLVRALLAAS